MCRPSPSRSGREIIGADIIEVVFSFGAFSLVLAAVRLENLGREIVQFEIQQIETGV